MTDRIYYQDSHATEFEARVTETGDLDDRPYVVLDRTAFYPTSGGQPYDVGRLVRLKPDTPGATNDTTTDATARVVEVIDREDDGAILHVIEGRLEAGAAVKGTIDWARRFDHMQQHTGQHVLSAAFDRLFDAQTVSFHLGTAACTIDLDRDVPAKSVTAAEDEANRVIWEDRLVSVRFASPAEAAALPLRKPRGAARTALSHAEREGATRQAVGVGPHGNREQDEGVQGAPSLRAMWPQRAGVLRLIEVEGYDLSACGGTHVARTGAVGVIAVSSWERFKGGVRVGFLCGGRALRAHRSLRDAVAGSIRVLSVLPDELPAAIARAQAENKQLRRTIRDLTDEIAVHQADALASRGARVGDVTLVAEALDGWDASGLKALATAVAAKPGYVAALVSATSPALIVIARAADTTVDAAAVLRALIARFGGKGGGKPDLAQGGGLAGAPAALLDAIRESIVPPQ